MRIDSGYPARNIGDVERSQKKGVQRQEAMAEGVTSEFSSDSVRLSSLAAQASAGGEIRHEKVASLKQAIESGTYQVSDSDLADAILGDVIRH